MAPLVPPAKPKEREWKQASLGGAPHSLHEPVTVAFACMLVYVGSVLYLVLDRVFQLWCCVECARLDPTPNPWSLKMATYGYGTPGAVPFTGYTNTLGAGQANQDAAAGQV